MAQHFLLSAASRTLSLKEIYKGGEEAAYQSFCKVLMKSAPAASSSAKVAAISFR
jgi:hypothetical protein